MKIIYLHGFASSPASSKAQFFASRFSEAGVECVIPTLDGGDFASLTISNQLAIVEREAASQPVILIGSSLGGYLSALYASLHPETEKVVLLAPAFCFGTLYPRELGTAALDEWKRKGTRRIPHYGYGEERDLKYDMIVDAARYPDYPDFSQPALLLHGKFDDVVPCTVSETFAASHPNARLRILASDHQLTDVTEILWNETKSFLGL